MTTWDELFAYRKALEVNPGALRAYQKIATMHGRYGKGPEGERCGDCVHLVGMRHAKMYWKCELFGNTDGPGTDWRKRFPACGKFEHV